MKKVSIWKLSLFFYLPTSFSVALHKTQYFLGKCILILGLHMPVYIFFLRAPGLSSNSSTGKPEHFGHPFQKGLCCDELFNTWSLPYLTLDQEQPDVRQVITVRTCTAPGFFLRGLCSLEEIWGAGELVILAISPPAHSTSKPLTKFYYIQRHLLACGPLMA